MFSVLNEGQSVHFQLARSDEATTASVTVGRETFTKTDEAPMQLVEREQYQQYPYGDTYKDELPDYQHPPVPAEPYIAVRLPD